MSARLRIFFVLFLGIEAAFSAGSGDLLWGVSSWRSVSLTAGVVLAAALLLLLIKRIRNGVARILEASGRIPARAAVIAPIAAFVIMWLLRYRHFLWADRYSMGLALRSGSAFQPAAPLAGLVYKAFYGAVNRLFFWNPFEASALLSAVAGILFVYASAAACGGARKGGGRPAATAMMVSGGYFAVFFGSGGSAPMAAAAAGVFILLAIKRLENRAVPLFIPALAAILAIFTGVSNIFLLPPLAYMILDAAARRESRLEAASTAATILICWVAADMTASYLTGSEGPTSHMIAAGARALAGMGASSAGATASVALNTLLTAGPASVFALVLLLPPGRWSRITDGDPAGSFLLVTTLSAAVFIIAAAPAVRGGLRWDLAAPAAASMAVFAARDIDRRSATKKELRSAAVLLAALGLFHLAPIVTSGASLEAGEKRLFDLPLEAGKAETIIGAQAWHDRDYKKAAEWWTKATEKAPEKAPVWYRLGLTDMKEQDYLDAVNHFHKAVKLEPDSTRYRTALAEAYIEQRWFPEAEAELSKLVAQFPDSARLWTRLGYARNHGAMFEKAIEAYETALALDPGNQEYVMNLTSAVLNRGAELHTEGDIEGAREMYKRARTIYPLNWVSINNLAALEIDQRNWGEALRLLTLGLKEHPEVPQLHYNMSVVLENLGDYEEALEHLRETARLDMLHPPPLEDFDRLQRKIDGTYVEP